MPGISVIVPVYNGEKYLSACIESILRQTYPDFELLLIDDGSTDDSLKICQKYADRDSRVRIFSQANRGVSSARNRGIDEARGVWLSFIDSDDWVTPGYLADFHPDELPPGYLAISGIKDGRWDEELNWTDGDTVIEYDNVKSDVKHINSKIFQKNLLLHRGHPVAKLFHSATVKQLPLRFNENLNIHEDHVFVLQYFLHMNGLFLTSEVNYNYNYNDTGGERLTTRLNFPEMWQLASDSLSELLSALTVMYDIDHAYARLAAYDFVFFPYHVGGMALYAYNRPRVERKCFLKKKREMVEFLLRHYSYPRGALRKLNILFCARLPISLQDLLNRWGYLILGTSFFMRRCVLKKRSG